MATKTKASEARSARARSSTRQQQHEDRAATDILASPEQTGVVRLAAELSERLLDKPEVERISHLGTVKRNRLERADDDLLRRLGLASPFPKRRWIGRRCYWLLSEVVAWLRALPAGYGEPIVDPAVTSARQKRRHAEARADRERRDPEALRKRRS